MTRLDDSRGNLQDDFDELGEILEREAGRIPRPDAGEPDTVRDQPEAVPRTPGPSVASETETPSPPAERAQAGDTRPDAGGHTKEAVPAKEDIPATKGTSVEEGTLEKEDTPVEGASPPDAPGSEDPTTRTTSWTYLGKSNYRTGQGLVVKRTQFSLRLDQYAALTVFASLNMGWGTSPSEVARTAFDLLGMNGKLAIPGLEMPENVDVPDRLIGQGQWNALVEAARELTGRSGSGEGGARSEESEPSEAVLVAVAHLVQDALHQAGYGEPDERPADRSF